MTICTEDRLFLFGEVIEGRMIKSQAGEMVHSAWWDLPRNWPPLGLDAFQVMPNHIHGIMVITGRGESRLRPMQGDRKDRPYEKGHDERRPGGTLPGTVGQIVQGFKSTTTDAYITGVKQQGWPRFPGRLWHRNYYEHVIRNRIELNRIREYICNNPLRWPYDAENPDRRAEALDDMKDILSHGGDPPDEL